MSDENRLILSLSEMKTVATALWEYYVVVGSDEVLAEQTRELAEMFSGIKQPRMIKHHESLIIIGALERLSAKAPRKSSGADYRSNAKRLTEIVKKLHAQSYTRTDRGSWRRKK